MNVSPKIGRVVVLILLAIVLPAAAIAKTAATTTSPEPDPNANPVLAGIIKLGAQLYYIGNHAGLDGWFIVKDGQVQIAYGTADGKNALIGAMFGPHGENITSAQVEPLLDAHPEIKALLTAPPPSAPSPFTNPPPATPAGPALSMTGTPGSPALSPVVTAAPSERLYRDLLAASGVTIGSSGPQILMVMDPDCSHCQATWRALRDSVLKGSLQIHMIPIGTEGTENERAAAKLLHVADPLAAWDKYVSGDKTQLAGTPAPDMIAAVQANHKLTDSWNIEATPFMVYRAKDGKVKIEQGEPEKTAALLNDLAP